MALSTFLEAVRQYGMLDTGDRVVVSLSGGPDSTTLLLHLLEVKDRFGLSLHAVHFNHALRGAESEEDERFVKDLCRRGGTLLEVIHAPFGAEGSEAGENLQGFGRRVRLRHLDEVRSRLGFTRIALGHTLDDVTETLLMRLIRGSGLTGLAGLYPVLDGLVIRPLIDTTRESILGYLAERGEPYREDSSNLDQAFLRNRVRHELIVHLERKYNPGIRRQLAVTARLIRDDESLLHDEATRIGDRLIHSDRGPGDAEIRLSIDTVELSKLTAAMQRRVIREAVHRSKGDLRRIGFVHVEAVIGLADGCAGVEEKRIDLPEGLRVKLRSGRLTFARSGDTAGEPDPEFLLELSVPGLIHIDQIRCTVSARLIEGASLTGSKPFRFPDVERTALLSPEVLHEGPIVVRARRPGDRYRPAGAPGGRKVKRMLIDRKVPRTERGRIPVITAGERILWVPGERPAEGSVWNPEIEGHCLRLDLERRDW